jgi:hypothetical protein
MLLQAKVEGASPSKISIVLHHPNRPTHGNDNFHKEREMKLQLEGL